MCHLYPSLKRILTMVTVTLLSVFSLDGYAQRTGGTPDVGAFGFGVPAPIAQCIAVTVPADANCQAFVSPQAINDNSYASGTTVSLSMSPSGPFPIGTHTVTLTVARDDRPDMTASCTTTITVTDQTGPAITPVNPTIALDANGQASITASDVTSSIIDNCDPNPTTTLSKTTFDCTDLANNIGNAQPGSISGTLTADNLFEWYISTDDNVQGTLVGTGNNWTVVYNYMENLPAGQTYYIHVKATDVGGPEFFCGKFNLTGGFVFANGTQSLNTNAAEWKVSTTGWNNYTTPYFVGNVGFQPWGFTISSLSPAQLIWEGNWNTVGGETRYFSAPIYPVIPGTNVTITSTDNVGNQTVFTANVILEDNIDPVAVANSLTLSLDNTGNATITAADIDGGSTDNCGIHSMSIDRTSFSCADAGQSFPVTLTVSDISGNTSTASASVTVSSLPTIVAVPDIFNNVNSGQPFTFNASSLLANDSDPLGQNLQVDAVINPSAGTIVDNFDGTYTFNAPSGGAQTVTADYIVKRDDGTILFTDNGHFYEFVSAPGITWSSAKSQAEGRYYNGMQGYLVTVTSASEDAFVQQKLQGEGWIGASDEETELTWKWVTGPEAGTVFWNQATQTPVNGQYANWSQGEPNDFKYGNPFHPGEDWGHYYSNGVWNDFPNSAGSIAGYIVEYGGMPGDCTPNSTAQAGITFNVIDATPPTVITQNITVNLDANGQVSILPSDVDNGSSDPSGIASLSLDVSSFDCSNLGTNTVTLTVTDNNGQSATGTAIVSVTDLIAPTAAVNNFTVQLDVTGTATISVSDIDAGSSDNCAIVSSSLSRTTFNCNDGGNVVPVTLTVLDASGNIGSAIANVTVQDVQPVTANADVFNVNTGQSLVISEADLIANDVDPYGQVLQVDAVSNPSSGTIVDNLNGTWTFTPNGTSNQTVTASYTVKRDDGTIVFADNGHFYEFVSAPGITWTNAKIAAEQLTYNGMQGYLVTVTSANENAFVTQKLQGQGWMGATDAETEDLWKWVTGPEAGTAFFQRSLVFSGFSAFYTYTPLNGLYNNWGGSEPNNLGGEDYAHFLTNGFWNDYPNSVGGLISGYIVEYGGMPGDCNTASSSNGAITINVIDATPPTVLTQNITISLDANGNASIVPADVDNGTNDASGIASLSLDISSFNCSNVGTNTVTLTAVDNNGVSASGTAQVTVEDNTNPTATFVGGSVSINPNRSVTVTAASLTTGVSDNCSNTTLTLIGQSTFDCNDVGQTFPISVQVTDGSGNSITVSGNITINDVNSYCNTPPVAICNAQSVAADQNCEAGVFAQAFNGGSYDPDGDPITQTITPAGPFGLGTHTVLYTVTDDKGESSSCTTTITVTDQSAPVIATQDITIALDANGQASITPSDVVTSYFDNCSAVTLSLDQTQFDCNSVPAVNGTGGPGTLTGTLTVDNLFEFYISTDDNVQGTFIGSGSNWAIPYTYSTNLAAGQTYYIHVKATDVGGPEMFLGNFNLTGGFQFANGTQNLVTNAADWQVSPTGWNNYTNPLYLGNIGFGPWGFGLFSMSPAQFIWHGSYGTAGGETKYFTAPIYPTATGANVTVTATDAYGNQAQQSVTVNVVDNMAPTASVNNINVVLDANGNASITASDVDNGSSDNCGITSYSLDVSSFTCADAGTSVPVTMTVTDASGNSASATAQVNVIDNSAPNAIVASNIVVALDANGAGSLTVADVDGGSTDNCSIASSSIDVTSFSCADAGTVPVTLTVVDPSGNTSTAVAQVQVVDNINPTVVLASNLTVVLDANGAGSITAADVDGGSSDNCAIASTSIDVSNFSCADVGANAVTLTVVDVNGNSSSATAQITVIDNTAPTVVLANNIVVALDANGAGSLTAGDVDAGSFDNCGIASTSIDVTSLSCADVGTVPVTLTVIDNNGNMSSAIAQVQVVDNINPTAVLASNIVVSLDANGAGSLTVGDVDAGSFDNCAVASTSIDVTSFSCADVGTVPVTLTVTDVNGNTSTATAQVQVVDNIAPTAMCKDIVIDLPEVGNATITASMIDNGSFDNCGIASISVSPSSFDCATEGDNTVTLTVTDVNGNVSTCTSTVTVVKSPIVVTAVQSDYNGFGVSCTGSSDGAIDLTVSGACQPYSFSWSNGAATEDVSGLSVGTYTVIVTDGNGETYNYSYTITEPTPVVASKSMFPYQMVSGQLDSTIFLGYGPQSTTLSVNAGGGVGGYTYAWSPATGLNSTNASSVVASPMQTTTYTCVITDANGCSVSKSITVNVIDARDPNNPNKVVLCHLRRKKTRLTWHTISVSVNAVPAHLGHGDYLGPCDNNSTKIEIEDEHEAHALHAHLFPNPTNATSTLSLEIEDTEEVAINLFDARGALIENIHQGVLTGEYEHEFEISSSGLAPGVYNVVIQTADGMEALRWVIVQ